MLLPVRVGERGEAEAEGGPDNGLRRRPESGPSRPLTESSHCRALVVEVLLADLTQQPGVHLLQDDAEGTLSGTAPGDPPHVRGADPAPKGERQQGSPGLGFHRPQAPPQPPTPLPCPRLHHRGRRRCEDTGVPPSSLPQPPTLCEVTSSRLPKPALPGACYRNPAFPLGQGDAAAVRQETATDVLTHGSGACKGEGSSRVHSEPPGLCTDLALGLILEHSPHLYNLPLYPWASRARPQGVPGTPGSWGRGSSGTRHDRQRPPCWSQAGAMVVLGLSPPLPTPPLAAGLPDSPSR